VQLQSIARTKIPVNHDKRERVPKYSILHNIHYRTNTIVSQIADSYAN